MHLDDVAHMRWHVADLQNGSDGRGGVGRREALLQASKDPERRTGCGRPPGFFALAFPEPRSR